MIHQVSLFLETDTIDYIDAVAKAISEQIGHEVNRSGAVKWLVKQHWKKTQIDRLSGMRPRGAGEDGVRVRSGPKSVR